MENIEETAPQAEEAAVPSGKQSHPEEVMVEHDQVAEVKTFLNHRGQRITAFVDMRTSKTRYFGTGFYAVYPETAAGKMAAHPLGFDKAEDAKIMSVLSQAQQGPSEVRFPIIARDIIEAFGSFDMACKQYRHRVATMATHRYREAMKAAATPKIVMPGQGM